VQGTVDQCHCGFHSIAGCPVPGLDLAVSGLVRHMGLLVSRPNPCCSPRFRRLGEYGRYHSANSIAYGMPRVIIISNGTPLLGLLASFELSLAPCMAPFLTTKHSLQLRKGVEGLGCPPCHSLLLPGSAYSGCAGPPVSRCVFFRA
jgi:hypothetical protein